jgi:hypothetical protein
MRAATAKARKRRRHSRPRASGEAPISSHVYIVCSDQARNGKSLFARLYADCLSLTGPDQVRIFDTDFPNGGLAQFFPYHSEIIDLSRTIDQVRLFDTIIGEPNFHYVIDLQSELLTKFFKIFSDIRFDEGAMEAGIGVAVFFIVDRSMSSISAAEKVRAQLTCSEFIMVRNDAIGTLLHLPSAAEKYLRIDKDRDLVLPRLSPNTLAFIEQRGFTFTDFIAGEMAPPPDAVRLELWKFLETIYNQRSMSGSGTTLLI